METSTVITKEPHTDGEKQTSEYILNLSVGLKQLSKSRTVTIKQVIHPVEVLLCCVSRPCQYTVYADDDKEHFLSLQEVSDCCARHIWGAARGFVLTVTDTDGYDAIHLIRLQTCSRGCCGVCCVLPTLEVQCPRNVPVAVIRERRTFCCPVYEIVDQYDEVLFTMSLPCSYISLMNLLIEDIEIDITNRNGELAARLCKQTKLNAEEYTGASNNFSIKYLTDLPIQQKVAILGSVFLIDFHYFEGQNRCCC